MRVNRKEKMFEDDEAEDEDGESTDRKKKKTVSPEIEFANSLSHDLYKAKENLVYHWNGSFWEVPTSFEKTALRWLAQNNPKYASSRKARSLVDTAVNFLDELPEADQNIIPVLNGYLRLSSKGSVSLETSDPSFGITYTVNAKYDPQEKAPAFENFLNEVQPDSDVRSLIQEYVGYTFLTDTRFQKCQAWIGKGRNGKGTLANIIASLHRRVAAINIASLSGFGLSGLVGASLVRVDELPRRIDEGFFKTLISGDPILVDIKHKSPMSMRVKAKWIMCGNDLFQIRDQSDGVWRRLQIIPFTVQIPENKIDPFLEKKIVEGELSGVLNWALEGLQRLLQRGKFIDSKAVATALVDARFGQNSIYAWVRESEPKVVETPEIPKDIIYTHYKNWSDQRGFKAENEIAFWKNLRNYLSPVDVQRKRDAGSLRYYVNIAVSA